MLLYPSKMIQEPHRRDSGNPWPSVPIPAMCGCNTAHQPCGGIVASGGFSWSVRTSCGAGANMNRRLLLCSCDHWGHMQLYTAEHQYFNNTSETFYLTIMKLQTLTRQWDSVAGDLSVPIVTPGLGERLVCWSVYLRQILLRAVDQTHLCLLLQPQLFPSQAANS